MKPTENTFVNGSLTQYRLGSSPYVVIEFGDDHEDTDGLVATITAGGGITLKGELRTALTAVLESITGDDDERINA